MKRPWMSSRDKRLWQSATTVSELGELMARWLEGDIKSWPGYMPNCGPEEETSDLIPALAAANRSGYVTTQSQPGGEARGFDGRIWRQRAAVTGHVADSGVLDRLRRAAQQAGCDIIIHGPNGRGGWVEVTVADGEIITSFGEHLSRRDIHSTWPGLHRHAFKAVAAAWQVTLIHPTWGSAGTPQLIGALKAAA